MHRLPEEKRELENNAFRLAYTLYQMSDDEHTVKQLAALLHYVPEQLKKDMNDIWNYFGELDQLDRYKGES